MPACQINQNLKAGYSIDLEVFFIDFFKDEWRNLNAVPISPSKRIGIRWVLMDDFCLIGDQSCLLNYLHMMESTQVETVLFFSLSNMLLNAEGCASQGGRPNIFDQGCWSKMPRTTRGGARKTTQWHHSRSLKISEDLSRLSLAAFSLPDKPGIAYGCASPVLPSILEPLLAF